MADQTRIHYGVAMSLDGYIADVEGKADWMLSDPAIDFAAIWSQFDTVLMGRRTYAAAQARLGAAAFQGWRTFVASATLQPQDHPTITVLPSVTQQTFDELRAGSSKDIWLMGGAALASTSLALGAVDIIDLSVMPVLLGAGLPLAPHLPERARLRLLEHTAYPSGIVRLQYAVER